MKTKSGIKILTQVAVACLLLSACGGDPPPVVAVGPNGIALGACNNVGGTLVQNVTGQDTSTGVSLQLSLYRDPGSSGNYSAFGQVMVPSLQNAGFVNTQIGGYSPYGQTGYPYNTGAYPYSGQTGYPYTQQPATNLANQSLTQCVSSNAFNVIVQQQGPYQTITATLIGGAVTIQLGTVGNYYGLQADIRNNGIIGAAQMTIQNYPTPVTLNFVGN